MYNHIERMHIEMAHSYIRFEIIILKYIISKFNTLITITIRFVFYSIDNSPLVFKELEQLVVSNNQCLIWRENNVFSVFSHSVNLIPGKMPWKWAGGRGGTRLMIKTPSILRKHALIIIIYSRNRKFVRCLLEMRTFSLITEAFYTY